MSQHDELIAVWTIHAWGRDRHRSPRDSRVVTLRASEYRGLSGDEMAALFERRRDEALEYARGLMDPKRIKRVTVEFVWV
jgi:hypothetical protein